jgi:hypothetical protein
VILSELFVDWLKHAFITKFNHIRPSVYERYADVLCRDFGVSPAPAESEPTIERGEHTLTREGILMRRRSRRKHQYVDQSPVVARRLGFAPLPNAILAVLIGSECVQMVILNASADSTFVSRATMRSGYLGRVNEVLRAMWGVDMEWAAKVGRWSGLGVIAWLW